MSARVVCLVMIGLLSLSPLAHAQKDTSGALAQVKSVLERAMEIQTRSDLQGDAHRKERARLVRELISQSFVTEDMARESVSGAWGKASGGQRSEYLRLFSTLFQDSYTRMVLNFLKKETIDYPGEPMAKSKGVLVQTVIMRANEHIPVNYSLTQQGGKWMIRDVEIDGVSIVENYRGSFSRVIRSSSFASLLDRMRVQSLAIADDGR
ncbi:MAG: ABC transporter substrate-binding protein [Syntrophobacteraceae bacterium]